METKNSVDIDDLVNRIKELATKKESNQKIFIAIAGIGGSGKTTLANKLKSLIDNSQIIPLDGYHLYRKDLTEEQIKYRGRIDTFNLENFKKDLSRLLNSNKTQDNIIHKFPSFDHKIKDPIEMDIEIAESTKYIIFEGLYLLSPELSDIIDLFDLKIFLETDINNSMERVIERNFLAGISNSREASRIKTLASDLKNAETILQNSKFDDKVLKFKFIE